ATLLLLIVTLPSSAQFLKTSGKKIVDNNGHEVILRGMGLGGWMLQEPYMMEMGGFASAQWEIKSKIRDLIGAANTDAFYDAWHANHCTKKDIDSLAAWGFNSVRLPMHYNLYTLPIEDETIPGVQTWLEKGFALTDSLIKWCSARHMYVILDLHAAPGGQGHDYAICDGNPAWLSLWESAANRQKTIALWKKLAERYVNEPWVGGYDLLNEPNWNFTGSNPNGCSETTNIPLRQLLISITDTIRKVDTRHLIIIEGNCWGGNYNGILPAWDNNMVVSFHKYWNNNDQNSIQGMLNIRDQYNIPLWMGESGENSNTWFTEAIQLAERNGIGWAWWPLKKINSVVGPMTIIKTPEYQTLLDYWNNGGTKPSQGFAYYTMMQMASNAKAEYCTYHKDVIDAMFRQVNDSSTKPFTDQHAPGIVHATDYDLGRFQIAYFDTDVSNPNVSTGSGTEWNKGYSYRNDGVDIEKSSDQDASSNGYDVGWNEDSEWLQYTMVVDSTAAYNVRIRYAGLSGSRIKLAINQSDISGTLSLTSTGGYQTWNYLTINDVILYKGPQKLRLFFEKGGINFGFLGFTLSKKVSEVPLKAVSAETYQETELINLSLNKMLAGSAVSADGFTCTVNGTAAGITSLGLSSHNPSLLVLSLGEKIYDGDTILLNYSGGHIIATDSSMLENFSNLPVKNNLPVHLAIPGKIEAEAFSFNQGLQLETTTDVGGGQDVGYTNTGDYLDYIIRVKKSAKYTLEVRIACYSNAGIIEVQQMNENGNVLNSCTVNIPVTGGWQTWRTVTSEITLTEGTGRLRVEILKPEFNMNWYKFTEKSEGIAGLKENEITVYPNPARDELTVEIPPASRLGKTVVFRTMNGVIVRKMELPGTEGTQKLHLGDLPKGFYVLEVELSGMIYRTKLIIQ
ncbi:MAG: carbohydrate-binding protein, partial [Bacteroidetes bacterium]|nr:carbohydrate-binding protein [Bacteroidota bacterium]